MQNSDGFKLRPFRTKAFPSVRTPSSFLPPDAERGPPKIILIADARPAGQCRRVRAQPRPRVPARLRHPGPDWNWAHRAPAGKNRHKGRAQERKSAVEGKRV